MRTRKAKKADFPDIMALAKSLDLDYPGMEVDAFWVAEADGRIAGIVGLKKHPDCLELCGLGVEPAFRGQGLARELVRTLLDSVRADVFLATVIPAFFERCGFSKAADIPRSFSDKWDTAWCEGCDRKSCTVMVSRLS
jgi:N-acetylglutamate synthase-like GNAT family acetyltransferase